MRSRYNIQQFFFVNDSKALSLDEDTRMDLLRKHPATVARLFEIKQECIWKNILDGKNKPIGEKTDFWRRIEVT
jgi:hypothetical protein